MRDGIYHLNLMANGYCGNGELNLTGNRGMGVDGKFRVELQLQGGGPSLSGTANVRMSPRVIRNAQVPERYSLTMSGNEHDDSFSLIGIGPLGLIVEITAERVER